MQTEDIAISHPLFVLNIFQTCAASSAVFAIHSVRRCQWLRTCSRAARHLQLQLSEFSSVTLARLKAAPATAVYTALALSVVTKALAVADSIQLN